ncbi:MAG: P1 family peptidase [Planctomycetota bacterium]|jgi:L-aminopeptidase/D-esterase-like protein
MKLASILLALTLTHAHPALAQQDHLVPDISVDGPVLEFDFPEIHVGIAEYNEGPTGTTVFYFPEPVRAAVDVRGGGGTVVLGDVLRQARERPYLNAVCFSGGSWYGLSATTGVANELKRMWSEQGQWRRIADVAGAIVFDLGERRLNNITPDDKLGAAALRSAMPGVFPLGAQGAGRFTMQGWPLGMPQHSGQGAAFREVGDIKVAVFTVVNAAGIVVDRDGRIVRCGPEGEDDCDPINDVIPDILIERGPAAEALRTDSANSTNTTITLLVTNVDLPYRQLDRLAKQVHTSMARAIHPFATLADGDVFIAATTGQVKPEGLGTGFSWFGLLASEVAWDAVLASVPELPERPDGDPVDWTDSQLDGVVGEYRFSEWASLRVVREENSLVVYGPEVSNLYISQGVGVTLTPISENELRLEGVRKHRFLVEREGDRVTALILEPQGWPQRAERVE